MSTKNYNLNFTQEQLAQAIAENERKERESLEWERINRPDVYAAIIENNERVAKEYEQEDD